MRQIQSQKAEVDNEQTGSGGCFRRGQIAWSKHGGQGQLIKAGASLKGTSHHVLPVQGGGHGFDCGIAQSHHVSEGTADNSIQGHQNQQGNKGPQTAASGTDLVLRVKFLNFPVVPVLIISAALLDLLELIGHQIHFDHTLFPLQIQRKQDDLDHHGKQDQRDAVAVEQVAEYFQQPTERRHDNLKKIHTGPPILLQMISSALLAAPGHR